MHIAHSVNYNYSYIYIYIALYIVVNISYMYMYNGCMLFTNKNIDKYHCNLTAATCMQDQLHNKKLKCLTIKALNPMKFDGWGQFTELEGLEHVF